MEVEDPLSAKFRTLIERLMVTTTSEIVKIFSKVLLETRMEITRSWKEIDMLKQHLEKCEQEKRDAIIMAQRGNFKREDDEMEVSHLDLQFSDSDIPGPVGLGGSADNVSVEHTHVSLGNDQACQPGTSGEHQVKNSNKTAERSLKTKSPKTKCTQFVARPKMGCPTKVPRVKRQKSTSYTTRKSVENGPSTSVGEITTGPKAKVKKEASVSTQKRPNNFSVYRALRDRQHLSMQRHCLCCSSDGCDLPSSPFRAQHQVPSVYICRKCERRFKSNIKFKNHKCTMPQNCIRCGQVFTTLQGLFAHSQEVQSPFGCNECDEMFATPCSWTVHKRIHTNLIIPKEIKAKRFEVRLKRISDSQLEAALLQNNSSSPNHNMTASETNLGSACEQGPELTMLNMPETSTTQTSLLDSSGGQSSVRKVYAIMSASSCQIQISGDVKGSEPSTVCKNETITEPSASDESVLTTTPTKRKMAECSHDAYNGVFPVENILKWRNNKGRTEVRVKWMPCTLCGAKFQNTWEPAESFPGYLDDKNEDTKKN